MSSPEVSIRWGGGPWRRTDKRYLTPIVNCAVDIARDGIDHFDIPVEQPKTAVVYLCGRDYPNSGEALGPSEFDLNFRAVDVKRKKIFNGTEQQKRNIGTAFHELLHCVRSERHDDDSVEELIVSEGISYVGTELFLSELGLGRKFRSIPLTTKNQRNFFSKKILLESLRIDLDNDLYGDEDLYDRWLSLRDDRSMPVGVLLGCFVISGLLEEGAALKDIVRMDAHEILGL